ncbi:TRAP transporter small permease [Pyramidobacter sp. SM-530-WT-4B]|mgnify:CR=1 FL=1|uniref:TRAP transporter small permease n=1 Tax=Pyramidobacter porci TaxID=2605789 RepID=A0A6L5YBR9_9BACT|nr:TRAP transporter small permease [Pyramidobacter porci]MCI6259704.1 TRAP transporter small permease [Pyramidobacter sp.]MST55786.1 TRAP transporter small permease [Pyramidobacter porci]
MSKLAAVYNKIEENLLYLSLICTVTVIFIQVVMRYVFSNSLSWSEELARYVFIWQTWLGASYATRMHRHLRIEVLSEHFHGNAKKTLELIVLGLWIFFGAFLFFKGSQLVGMIWHRRQVSAAMGIPIAIPYAAIPCGALAMTVRLVFQARGVLKGRPEDGNEAVPVEEQA